VVLIGPPGAGKSTVAAILAARLGTSVRDTDSDVEAIAGTTISDIFVEQGEPRFRQLEREAVVRALREHDGVLALGGGAVMDPLTENDLRSYPVVFLDVGLTDASQRIGFNVSRPLLIGNPRAQWKRLMDARRPVYEGLATSTVLTDGKSVEQVADEVLAQLER
jgi:shikimate kinase